MKDLRLFPMKQAHLRLWFVCFVLIAGTEIQAVDSTTVSGPGPCLNGPYLRNCIADAGSYYSAPLRWRGPDFAAAIFTISITAALYTQDEPVNAWCRRNRTPETDRISSVVTHFGESMVLAPALCGIYVGGCLFHNERSRRIALIAAESFVLGGVLEGGMKMSFHRHRPDSGDPYDRWDGPSTSLRNLSFPSGHSFAAFTLATVAASELREYRWVAPVAFSLASLTALSRMNDNKHWASDVFMGSALGFWSARMVTRLNDERRHKITVAPLINRSRSGLVMQVAL